MYDELVKKIRHCATDPMHCLSCGEVKDGRCFKRLMTQAADAIEELSKLHWISVEERLPELGKYVLVRFASNDMAVACYFNRDEGMIFWRAMTDDGWCADCDEIYKTYPSGGALHIVLDDGNTEDEFIRWCIENALKYVEEKDQWMFVRCAELMLTMPEHKRDRAIVTAFKEEGE